MKPRYILERWPYGWLLCKAPGEFGIPLDATAECMKIFPKQSFIQFGISHHLKVTGKSPNVMLCVTTEEEGEAWRKEIAAAIANLPMPERWWVGLDVGESSAAMFAVLRDPQLYLGYAESSREGAVPQDASDFGRCVRLLEAMPEWRVRLPEVALAHPATAWSGIVARWDEIAAAAPVEQGRILREISDQSSVKPTNLP